MPANVQTQAVGRLEAFGALVAGVGPLAGVNAHVDLQRRLLGEFLITKIAFKGPFTCMRPYMNVQIILNGKTFLTVGTGKGALVRVLASDVVLQCRLLGEYFGTYRTWIFWFL